ncbi:MAG TPA: CU044_2847 family protein [Thermoanaerobaculia bacterium]
METRIPVQLPGGQRILVEVTASSREELVSARKSPWNFDDISPTVIQLSRNFGAMLDQIAPDEAEIEFGLEIAVESDKLLALLVKGSGKGNLTIKLKWARQTQNASGS